MKPRQLDLDMSLVRELVLLGRKKGFTPQDWAAALWVCSRYMQETMNFTIQVAQIVEETSGPNNPKPAS